MIVSKSVWKGRCICGSATFTMLVSSTDMNRPIVTTMAICHLCSSRIVGLPSLVCLVRNVPPELRVYTHILQKKRETGRSAGSYQARYCLQLAEQRAPVLVSQPRDDLLL